MFCFVTLNNFTLTFHSQINGFKALFHMKYFKYILLSSPLLISSCEDKSSRDSVTEDPQEDTFLKSAVLFNSCAGKGCSINSTF